MRFIKWPKGEIMKLDAVFVPPTPDRVVDNYPVPIIVAVEHENDPGDISNENDPGGFSNEITKLAYFRCPLKVGITYMRWWKGEPPPSWPPPPDYEGTNNLKKSIQEDVCRTADILDRHSKEDPDNEYLYLLGVEETLKEITWYAFSFRAGDGPKAAQWRKA
jgi:hypothetical protein